MVNGLDLCCTFLTSGQSKSFVTSTNLLKKKIDGWVVHDVENLKNVFRFISKKNDSGFSTRNPKKAHTHNKSRPHQRH